MELNKNFEVFYNELNHDQKNLINFSLVHNPKISISTYQYLLKYKINKYDKKAFSINYSGNSVPNKKYILKEVTTNNLNKLKQNLDELDGTLLSDVVSQYIRNHKIF